VRFLVIMDPPSTVKVDEDTSFALMLEAQSRGHRVDHCLQRDLYLDDGKLFATVRPATMQRVSELPIVLGAPEDLCLHDIDAIFVRTDPPFDSDYLWCTLMLDRVKTDTLVLNDPHGLRQANEKLYACYFPELMPRTLVTSDKAKVKRFLAAVGGKAVIKPLGGAGGEGVLALTEGDLNLNTLIELTTHNGKRVAMAQEFLPAVREGDKRILLLGGEPLGAILRVPRQDDVRSNIHAGGSVVKATVTAAEQELIAKLRPRLLADGLHFVGLDVIGGKLTEINVTSPTGIQQMSRLDGVNRCARVIEWVEQRAHAHAH
jgi:glutathione synthase